MLAVDTNVLVRHLVRDDPSQAAAADAFIASGAWVSHVVLVEAMWVLASIYGRSAAHLAAALEMLLTHESLVLQDADAVTAAVATFRSKSALGFSDCLVLEIARKHGHMPLGTFDKTLARLRGADLVE